MPRIVIAGSPTGSWTNLGDEAILAGMLSSLRAAIPVAEIVVVSSSPAGFFDRYGCAEVRHDDVAALTATVQSSDLVVIGGGSIFFDYWGCDLQAVLTPAHHGLSLWTSVALLAAAARVPSIVYAAGVGPIRTRDGELLARVIFELAASVTTRDTQSAREVARLTNGTVRAVVTADPALACVPSIVDAARAQRTATTSAVWVRLVRLSWP
jgi:polysaccharide pyruvyl transferase WcaK-like protein